MTRMDRFGKELGVIYRSTSMRFDVSIYEDIDFHDEKGYICALKGNPKIKKFKRCCLNLVVDGPL
jgi:hypothetical protein